MERVFVSVLWANTCARIGGQQGFGGSFRLHLEGRSENMNEEGITSRYRRYGGPG